MALLIFVQRQFQRTSIQVPRHLLLRMLTNFLRLQVRQLMKFWTGSRTVPNYPPNHRSRLKVKTTGTPGWLPQSSTCFNDLRVPLDLIGHGEELTRRVRTALEFGSSGTGFG